jgi:hypothetical protein
MTLESAAPPPRRQQHSRRGGVLRFLFLVLAIAGTNAAAPVPLDTSTIRVHDIPVLDADQAEQLRNAGVRARYRVRLDSQPATYHEVPMYDAKGGTVWGLLIWGICAV